MITRNQIITFLSLIGLFFFTTFDLLLAQSDLGVGFNPEANVPTSPEAASLGKYGDIPVSNYSGIANIDVPLYTVKSKDISVPISMSYFSNGIGVAEEASWTGLGWTLNAGGMISRTIRGKDDFGYSQACSNYLPYYSNRENVPNYPLANPFLTDNGNWKAMGTASTSFESVDCVNDECPVTIGVYNDNIMLNQFLFQPSDEGWDPNMNPNNAESYTSNFFCPNEGRPERDLEPDVFTFNFLGFSGKFVIDREGNCVLLEKQDVKIEITGSAPHYSWIITTNNGTEYYFGYQISSRQVTGSRTKTHTINNSNNANPVTITNSCGGELWDEHISSWYLDKIKSVNGDVIEFGYEKTNGAYIYPIPVYSESANDVKISTPSLDATNCLGLVPVPGPRISFYASLDATNNIGSYEIQQAVYNKSITEIRYDKLYLKTILYDFGKVIFNRSSRTDLSGADKLEELEIFAKKNNTYTPYKKYKFNYGYFTSSNTPEDNKWNTGYIDIPSNRLNTRLKLKSIEDRGNDFDTLPGIPPYSFSYNETTKLPSKTSMSLDHWGYANGPENSEYNTTLVPNWEGVVITENNEGELVYALNIIEGADKEPKQNYTEAFLLKEVKYPTGGFTKLEYEPNWYSNIEDPHKAIGQHASVLYRPIDDSVNVVPKLFSVSQIQKHPVAFANVHINWTLFGDVTSGQCDQNLLVNKVREDLYQGIGFQAIIRDMNSPTQTIIYTRSFDHPNFYKEDNSFSLTEMINLTPGGNYQMELVPTCAFTNLLPENISIDYHIEWLDYELIAEKIGGGVRIKSIEDHDGANPANKKWFEYENDQGVSSGIAINHPAYMKYRLFNGGCQQGASAEFRFANMLIRSSTSITPLSRGAAGSFIGYGQVTLHRGANDEGGKSIYHYYNEAQIQLSDFNPEGVPFFYNQKNGSLLKQIDYKKESEGNYVLARELENTYYSSNIVSDKWIWGIKATFNPWMYSGYVAGDCSKYRVKLYAYSSVPQWHYISSTEEKSYDENGENPIVSNASYEYEHVNYNLIASQKNNSDGISHRTEIAYAFSEDPAIFDANLLDKNLTGIPVQVKKIYGGTLVSGARRKYNTIAANTNLVLPTDFFKYEYDPNQSEENNWVWKAKLIYNAKGYATELERPYYTDNYIYNWVDGLLTSRHYKDWHWEYNYTDDRLLKTIVSIDGLSSTYTYDRYRRLEGTSLREGNVQTHNTYNMSFGNNSIETQLIYSDADDQISKNIFDGLGRARATIGVGYGINQEDITTESFYYDDLGRLTLSNHFITSNIRREYEASILGRVTKEITYLESGPVDIKYHYYSNSLTDEVINYNGDGFYPPQTLYKTVMIDENGNKSVRFTDQLGRVVLSRKFVNGEAAENRVDTYTVYDNRGNVKEVITPGDGVAGPIYSYEYNAKNLLVKKTIPDMGDHLFTYDNKDRLKTSTDANGHVIITDYDDYDRPIRTTLQGEGILSETFYDNYQGVNKICTIGSTGIILKGKMTGSRVKVLEQDNLGDWLYTVNCYDNYGRIINTLTDNHLGGYDENQVLEINHADQIKKSRRSHQSQYGDYVVEQQFSFDHAFRLKNITHQVTGGNLNSMGVVNISQMNYNNKNQLIEKNLGGTLQSIDYQYNQKAWLTHINGVNTTGGDPIGLCPAPEVLGACTTCLPPEGSIPSTPNVPEKLLNPKVTLKFNKAALDLGQATSLALEQSYTLVSGMDSTSIEVKQTIKINSPIGPTVYTDSINKNLDNTSIQSADITDQVNNLINQFDQELTQVLTNTESIAKVNNELKEKIEQKWNNEIPSNQIADNDLFSMELRYDRGEEILGSIPQYNGNISQVFWQVKGRETQSYAFEYDELNRLKVAKYADVRNNNYLDGDQYTVKNLLYDNRGNIKTLRRYGMVQQNETCYKRWQIDDLKYSYKGNQLASVTDKTVNAQASEGYKGAGSFSYDANGNMIRDNNKGMTVIYNHLNLPKKFIFDTDAFIEILYDASGIKLQKKVSNGVNTVVKDYIAGIEYLDGNLEAIYHEEGRVVPGTDSFRYEYTLRDHLGNARISFSDFNGNGVIDETVETMESYDTEILQENHYYPFGMNMRGPWAPQLPIKNQYQYNGKELNEDLGLNWNDYGARWYQASIGRWHSIDPLAENFASWSPYNYVYNNPMIYNDPTGMAGNLAVGITIIFKKDDNISDEAFAAYTEEYINNVLKVWADKGTGGKITFKSVRGDFDEDDLGENENLVHVGDYGDDPSKVTGDNDEISFMNAKGSGGKNTPAHEFGHHMGLEDRYLEGFNWDLSGGIGARRTTPIGNDEINDLGYDPNNNLYSSGDATLTDYQIRVANGAEPPEPNYQKSRGIMYKHVGRNVEAIPYTVSNGKVSGLEQFKGSKRSTRKKLEKHIKLEKRF